MPFRTNGILNPDGHSNADLEIFDIQFLIVFTREIYPAPLTFVELMLIPLKLCLAKLYVTYILYHSSLEQEIRCIRWGAQMCCWLWWHLIWCVLRILLARDCWQLLIKISRYLANFHTGRHLSRGMSQITYEDINKLQNSRTWHVNLYIQEQHRDRGDLTELDRIFTRVYVKPSNYKSRWQKIP